MHLKAINNCFVRSAIFMLTFPWFCMNASGQIRGENFFSQKWLIDINTPFGIVNQNPTERYSPSYPSQLNSVFQNFKLSPAAIAGIDINGGCYFGKYKKFGVGIGISSLNLTSQVSVDNFHIEFKNTDAQDAVFRQLISSVGPVKEQLFEARVAVPLLFRYKQLLTKRLGFSIDAGLVLNNSDFVDYNTNSTFNYEAIYAYLVTNQNSSIHVYDGNSTPLPTDWLITVQNFQAHNGGSVVNYFDSLANRGYNVGLNVHPQNNSGKILLTKGSVGFTVRPSFNFKIKQRVYFYLGGFITYQQVNNAIHPNYRMIDASATNYSSMLRTVSSISDLAYGANIGFRIFMGHSQVYIERDDE